MALALLALLILNFSKGATIWTPTYSVTVESLSVGGLKPGASVLMSGVPVGIVKEIGLEADGRKVLILCRLEKRYGVHRDAKWEIDKVGQRVELAIRAESPEGYSPPVGTYAALFTAPAVG